MHEAVPEGEWEVGVNCAEAGNEVLFPSLDGALGSIAAM